MIGVKSGLGQIDSAAINAVAAQIFSSTEKKDSQRQAYQPKVDYSKFNRASLGTSLYANNINIGLTRQIAMNKTYLNVNVQNSTSIQYLNNVAAKVAYAA